VINKRKNLTKKEICKIINQELGISKLYSASFLDNLFDEIISEFKTNTNVKIHNFGTFTLRNKGERLGRDPKSLKTYIINKRNVVTFKISKKLEEKINNEWKSK
tara:strand:- start:197 stop:508 length:312 start_codon:yes stop_codon:yes gene_type:complete